MIEKTETEKFHKWLKKKSFDGGWIPEMKGIVAYYKTSIPAHHRITPDGDHNIISQIVISTCRDEDTPEDSIGEVRVSYEGTERKANCENVEDRISENLFGVKIPIPKERGEDNVYILLEKIGCCHTCEEAIKFYEDWHEKVFKIIHYDWKIVL